MVRGKYLSGNDDLSQIYAIRELVLQKELGIRPEAERDGYDEMAMHAIVFEEEVPVAVGRILYDGEIFKISHIAVKAEYRNCGYGDFVVRMLLNRAVLAGAEEVYATTLPSGEKLFRTIGFEACEEVCKNGGLTYLFMRLKQEKLRKCCNCDATQS